MQAAVRDMLARGAPGTIVNVITMSSHGGQPYLAPYVAAKAGLAGLTRNAAHAHRWDRIRVNGVNIGWTETEGEDAIQREFHGAGDDWRELAAATLPMGKLGQVGGRGRAGRAAALRPQRRGHRVGHRLGPAGGGRIGLGPGTRVPSVSSYDVARVRSHFPQLKDGPGSGAAHFDGPGGSQTPEVVARAMYDVLTGPLANLGDATPAERNAQAAVVGARAAMADLLGADPAGIVFGRS